MILGQLYYYEKQLDLLSEDLSNLTQIELLGVDRAISEQGSIEEITDVFISGILDVFRIQKYSFNLKFWNYLQSVYKDVDLPRPSNSFQESVIQWIENGNNYQVFLEILQEGSLITNEKDFALYYALKALDKLLSFKNLSSSELTQTINGVQEFSNDPAILCFTNKNFFPLYKNYGIMYREFVPDYDLLLLQIKEVLENHTLDLVLIDSANVEILHKLSKKLKLDCIVTSFSMSNVEDSGFFDAIVKDTLGVRLA